MHELQMGLPDVLVFGVLGCRTAFAGASPKQISTRLHSTAFRRALFAETPKLDMGSLRALRDYLFCADVCC
jgi:hypothetical protein